MKYCITLMIFISYCIVTIGQDWKEDYDKLILDIRLKNEPLSRINPYEKIDGTPYLNDDFVNGTLITSDSIIYRHVQLRYNIYEDEMEFFMADDAAPRKISNPRSFLFFYLEDKVFVYLTFQENNRPRQGYFETFNKGYCQVLRRKHTVYAEPEELKAYSEGKPARFIERPNIYYLRFDNQIPEEIRLRRRNILQAFGERGDEIADFVRENNLSYRRIGDLVKMADYYNRQTGK